MHRMWGIPVTKYRAKRTEVDGIVFASKKEAAMYAELKLLQQAGDISDLKLQVEFVLQEGFTRSDGKKIRPIKYFADFSFYDRRRACFRVLDCKGIRTQVYEIKRKMFDYTMREKGIILEETI